jgi:hypothetical protein
MPRLDVRRMAAVDMYGVRGTTLRRRVILAEFIGGAAAMVLVGVWCVFGTNSVGWQVLGIVSIGVGLNYLPLAVHAVALSRPGALDAELNGVDLAGEGRYYTAAQFWIFVPLLLVVLAIRQGRRAA